MTEKTYPALPKHVAHIHSDGDFCWDMQPQPDLVFWPIDLYTADQMRAYYDLGRDMQAQAVPQHTAATLDLTPTIRWLENGCDPKEAAKELRILSTRAASMQASHRLALQRDGKHPAPCARFCEANAFEIEIRQLRASAQADALDAARYRWLRDRSRIFRQDPDMSGNHYWMMQQVLLRGPTLDTAIDAARTHGKEGTPHGIKKGGSNG